MSHYNVIFAFGKTGTYVLDHPKNTIKRNIPNGLKTAFQKDPVQQIISLALDANDNYYCYWETRDGGWHWAMSGGLDRIYPGFHTLWAKTSDKRHMRVTFGPNIGDHLTWNEKGKWSYWADAGTFDWIESDLENRRVRSAAIGAGNAQVVVFTDGCVRWNRLGQFPDLLQLLKQRGRDVIFVALNQYRRNEYFVVLADAEVHIRASAVIEQDIVKVLETYPDMRVISSTVVRRGTTVPALDGLPERARRKEFLKNIVNNVVSGAITGVIGAAFASCTVM